MERKNVQFRINVFEGERGGFFFCVEEIFK